MLGKCYKCEKQAMFYVLVEDDENSTRSHILELCDDCRWKEYDPIEVWTQEEWDE